MNAAPARSTSLALADIARYPVLSACLDVWRSGARPDGGLPAGIKVEELPKPVFPYLMLLDWADGSARVRLAGEYLLRRARSNLLGKRVGEVFAPKDAAIVEAAFARVATSLVPDLAERRYVSLDGGHYGYVRLICPLSRAGGGVDGFFKAIEPETLLPTPDDDPYWRIDPGRARP